MTNIVKSYFSLLELIINGEEEYPSLIYKHESKDTYYDETTIQQIHKNFYGCINAFHEHYKNIKKVKNSQVTSFKYSLKISEEIELCTVEYNTKDEIILDKVGFIGLLPRIVKLPYKVFVTIGIYTIPIGYDEFDEFN